MAALSITGRLFYGGLSIVALGAAGVVAWGARRTYTVITKEIQKSSPSTKPWLIVAKICGMVGTAALVSSGLFSCVKLASSALSGTFSPLPPTAALIVKTACYGGIALRCLQDFIRWACR